MPNPLFWGVGRWRSAPELTYCQDDKSDVVIAFWVSYSRRSFTNWRRSLSHWNTGSIVEVYCTPLQISVLLTRIGGRHKPKDNDDIAFLIQKYIISGLFFQYAAHFLFLTLHWQYSISFLFIVLLSTTYVRKVKTKIRMSIFPDFIPNSRYVFSSAAAILPV